jgi:adenylyltransferase/sulfurtransferase
MTPDSENSQNASGDEALSRYSRQVLFDRIGEEGQAKLLSSRVVLVGCGALGTVLANTVVRAGVGFLRICDRDFIERDNLQRQVLFDEDDIAANLPKAEAAARKLARINSDVTVEPCVVDVTHENIERLADGADLILDGTDNFEARFLINDLAVATERPWIYGAVVGSTGLCMPIVPHDTPCLRCVFEDAPPPQMNPTCDTVGVLSSAVNVVASLQATEAIKLLTGQHSELNRRLMHIDVWTGRVAGVNVQSSLDKGDCPCCRKRDFAFLEGRMAAATTTLCGRGAVQVSAPAGVRLDFSAIARKLEPVAEDGVRHNKFMLKARVGGFDMALFPDGRAIIKGTEDAEVARTLYARYVGM